MAELTYSVSAVGVRASEAKAPFKRILALDVVRGFAMLLMLISHSSWWLDDLDYGVAYGWDNMIVPQIHFPEEYPRFCAATGHPCLFSAERFQYRAVCRFAQAARLARMANNALPDDSRPLAHRAGSDGDESATGCALLRQACLGADGNLASACV